MKIVIWLKPDCFTDKRMGKCIYTITKDDNFEMRDNWLTIRKNGEKDQYYFYCNIAKMEIQK